MLEVREGLKMSRRLCTVLALFLTFSSLPFTARAKWWIFGQSENVISTRYLYLNGVSYDELGDKVVLYADALENGQAVLRGKAATSVSAVGAVQVSRDNKTTWEKAKRSPDGTFEYLWRPETGASYTLYVKIIDTTGKTNDIEATRKIVTLSDRSIRSLITAALEKLAASYMAEDPRAFMALVSENYAADSTILDRAIRKDFNLFDNLSLSISLTAATSGGGGKVFAPVSYRRSLVSTKTGKAITDSGSTEFVFSIEGEAAKVFSMKQPLLFGLSDAENVATGSTLGEGPFVVVGSDGSATVTTPGVSPTSGGVAPLSGGGGVAGAPGPKIVDLSTYPLAQKHHLVILDFTQPVDTPFDIIVEESLAQGGPWSVVKETTMPSNTGKDVRVVVMSDAIAQKATFLYYRVIIEKDGKKLMPSNVAVWDNR